MAGNGTATTPPPAGASCPDDTNDGLVAGLVICVVLLVAMGAVLLVLLAKHKGWINKTRFTFKIPTFGGTGRNSRSNDGESSMYQERLPAKTSKLNTAGNMSYDVCLPIHAGTGSGSVNSNKEDDAAGTRTSTASGRSYLELIVEPNNSSQYENVSTPTMRNKINGDHDINNSPERESEVYMNLGIDVSEEKNGKSILEPETEEFDEIYNDVGISVGNMIEEGDNYFVLEKDDSNPAKAHLSNQENDCDISENYFVLEPQNEAGNLE